MNSGTMIDVYINFVVSYSITYDRSGKTMSFIILQDIDSSETTLIGKVPI